MNNTNTALLVMDMQELMMSNYFAADAPFITKIAGAIAAARSKNIPVIYVVVGFRPGAPELNDKIRFGSGIGGRDRWTPEFAQQWVKIHPTLAPQQGDIIVTKRRVSAFTGSDLEVVLRGQEVRHIVLTGIATSGVVLSTVREAADKDYQITVLADGCADPDEETNRFLTTKIFPRQADVMNVADWK